jgi:hypothetical protein
MATLERLVPEKLLSDIDRAIDSGNVDKAYELVDCSNPQHDTTPLLLRQDVGCKRCHMLGIKYRGVDSDIAQYPQCVLKEYINYRKELKNCLR